MNHAALFAIQVQKNPLARLVISTIRWRYVPGGIDSGHPWPSVPAERFSRSAFVGQKHAFALILLTLRARLRRPESAVLPIRRTYGFSSSHALRHAQKNPLARLAASITLPGTRAGRMAAGHPGPWPYGPPLRGAPHGHPWPWGRTGWVCPHHTLRHPGTKKPACAGLCLDGGECGIRTHVGLYAPNRFRIGAVMTASVTLRESRYFNSCEAVRAQYLAR